ncbi:MAG TPA: Clp protease N-terminal domain-containing protein [Ktedonobacteraceae bacterium]
MERLLTTEEVAELLRIDVVTVRRLITRGELAAYRIAGEYRFTQAGVESFVESQRVQVGPWSKKQFDKFTERARVVLSLANEEARLYNHDGIGAEHILLAIMREGEGIAAKVLDRLDVSPGEVRTQIEALHPAGEQPVDCNLLGMTAQGKESIELAVREARSFDHHYIGTEHMLLGLLHQDESIATQSLLKFGVTLEKARELVKQMLESE